MDDNYDEYVDELADDLAGLVDCVETADWEGAQEIAEILREGAESSGWPIIAKLTGNLSTSLGGESAKKIPVEAIEVLADAMVMCVNSGYRKEADLDDELRAALDSLNERFGL